MVINSHPLYSKDERRKIEGNKLKRQKEFALNSKKLTLAIQNIFYLWL